jgi:hypothetical protein
MQQVQQHFACVCSSVSIHGLEAADSSNAPGFSKHAIGRGSHRVQFF